MMLNKPMVDWLTLTSFDAFLAQQVHTEVSESLNIAGRWQPERRLQYSGIANAGVFIGDATQRGRQHWMVQASGEVADALLPRVHGEPNCTRIDLQVTIRKPSLFDSRQCYDRLTGWQLAGRQRQVSIVQSGDGLDTIYVGSRASDRFTRIYVKPTDGGIQCLRFEVEYKADHAQSIFQALREQTIGPGEVLVHEVESTPDLTGGATDLFLQALGMKPYKPEIERVTGQNSTLDWLRKQVTPSILRLANDHEVGTELRYLVSVWYEHCYPSIDD